MKTGTDISIAECRASGYPVVEHGKRPLDPSKRYRLTISNPSAWTFCGSAVKFGARRPYEVNGWYSYADLWETFERAGDGIKSFCDFENFPYPSPTEEPCFMDFASLAQTLVLYCGLD